MAGSKQKYTEADFPNLTQAEKALIAGAASGAVRLGENAPKASSRDHQIRAKLLRAILLDSVEGVDIPKNGLRLYGAWIEGWLDLDFCNLDFPIGFVACVFDTDFTAIQAHFRMLLFQETALLGLNLSLATIDGNLVLQDSQMNGDISLISAKINRQLYVIKLKSQNENNRFILQSAHIGDDFIWQGCDFAGALDLTEARIGTIVDDQSSWPQEGKLTLKGATYTRFQGRHTPRTARERLGWLSLMGKFHPQPYKQLAGAFYRMGYDSDAREVLHEMERLRFEDNFKRRTRIVRHLRGEISIENQPYEYLAHRGGKKKRVSITALDIERYFARIVSWFINATIGFGYRSERALYWLGGMVLLMALLSLGAYYQSEMSPNAAPVLVSHVYLEIDDPLIWARSEHARDWETFNALAYGADVVLPLVDFGQESAWAPSTRHGFWSLGWHVWWLRWLLKPLGWAVVTLAIAALTGVLQRRHEE